MRIAVLTCTRDRLEYTQHCFASLRENAGCDYDHFVFDQGSQDGTVAWLGDQDLIVHRSPENVGIHRGWNALLDRAGDGYDVYVTFDNDCEVVQAGTLVAVAETAMHRCVASPTVRGLIHPPRPTGQTWIGMELFDLFPTPGGIFRAFSQDFARRFRFNESYPLWGGDEHWVGQQALLRGYRVGYLNRWYVNHYETTEGQRERYGDYFRRKDLEMGLC